METTQPNNSGLSTKQKVAIGAGTAGGIATLVVSALFLLVSEQTFVYEAGYADHPDDPGGRTMYGVTEAVARRHGYAGRMQDLPRETAQRIAYAAYWQPLLLDDVAGVDPALAAEIYDTGYNMGPGTAVGFVQRCLNAFNRQGGDYRDVAVDGRMGPQSLGALRALYHRRPEHASELMLECTNSLQGARYIALAEGRSSFESFTVGWFIHRVD